MANNIQTCNECHKKILGDFRMILMMGPKGFRRYAVHVDCSKAPPAKKGGRQAAKAKAAPPPALPILGERQNGEGADAH